MRVATFNVNGIRAAHRRGFASWLQSRDCDVVALQEVRCSPDDLPDGVFDGYRLAYEPGNRKGRNGVAILTRPEPAAVRTFAKAPVPRELRAFTGEGRYLEVDLSDRPLTVASLYLPKGGMPIHLQHKAREAPDGGLAYARKIDFLAGYARHVTAARRSAARRGRQFLLLGDLNIAHTGADLHNWRASRQVPGFFPEERAWFDALLGPRRLVDVVRRLNPGAAGPYSWWSWLGRAFDEDRGWRIDYHLASPVLARSAIGAAVDRADRYEERMSDHAPVVVDYRW